MRKMLSDQEKEDQHKRQMKMEAGKRYQQELDAQLKELRDRSFASLASKFIVSLLYCKFCLLWKHNAVRNAVFGYLLLCILTTGIFIRFF